MTTPNTNLDALDTFFGTIDELTSEHQKVEPNGFLTYNGDIVEEPLPFTDRTRITVDLMDKFLRRLPGSKIIDTEFIASGYFTALLPDCGPFKDVEVYIRPHYEESLDKYSQISIQWGGFSVDIGLTENNSRALYYLEETIASEALGALWLRCYHGLCIYEDWHPFSGTFPEYTCKNIEKVIEGKNAGLTIGGTHAFDTVEFSATLERLYEAVVRAGQEMGERNQTWRGVGFDPQP